MTATRSPVGKRQFEVRRKRFVLLLDDLLACSPGDSLDSTVQAVRIELDRLQLLDSSPFGEHAATALVDLHLVHIILGQQGANRGKIPENDFEARLSHGENPILSAICCSLAIS